VRLDDAWQAWMKSEFLGKSGDYVFPMNGSAYDSFKAGWDARDTRELYDLVGISHLEKIEEHIGTFSNFENAVQYAEKLLESKQETGWADEVTDGLAINGPYVRPIINPKFEEKE
jgi:hypothetical protein